MQHPPSWLAAAHRAQAHLRSLGLATVTVLAAAACQPVENGNGFFDAGPPVETADDSCLSGCELLDGCGQCSQDAAGNCISVLDCALDCRSAGQFANYLCITEANACDQASFDACFDGTGLDECTLACANLEACGRCTTDPSGNCLDSLTCISSCRADQVPGATCLAEVTSCDVAELDACQGDDGAGDDTCADACRALDRCEQCAQDTDGNCISIAGCAEQCRADWDQSAQCVSNIEACTSEEFDACFAIEPPADDCEAGCQFLDGCGLCLTDDEGACIEVAACTEQCRANDPTENACLNSLEACDEDAILVCLSPEVPPGDACDQACQALDGCDLCYPDENGECLTLEACAEGCRAGDPAPEVTLCLGAIATCEDVDACFSAPPIPDCNGACDALSACGALPGDDANAALAACKTACDGTWTEAERACISREAEEEACGDIATCADLSVTPPEFTCADACADYLACGHIADVDLNDCESRCTGNPDGVEVACVVAAGDDCEAKARCITRIEPQAPDCAYVCNREAVCERIADPEEDPAALEACISTCETADDRNQRICVGEAGEDCVAHAACFPAVDGE